MSAPLGVLHSHQVELELEVLGQLGQQVDAEAGAAAPLSLVVRPAPDASVHVALAGDVVRPGQVDEGGLLQVADRHVELLRHSGRGDVTLPRPDDVLDVEAVVLGVPGPPGPDLLPLLVRAGGLSAPPEVHDAQLHVPESPGLGEGHLGLA